jgi:protein-S-isoprenylcysteine O-methyltransferase Ste14
MKTMRMARLHQGHTARLLVGVVLAAAWLMFAIIHVRTFLAFGTVSHLVFFISETFTAMMFLVRTNPQSVSDHAGDWLLAVAGTGAPLLFAPAAYGVLPAAASLVLAGAMLQLIGLVSLNRSIGLVPALRELKTGGSFRVVRHPLYASYLVMFSGYLLANSTLNNLLVYGLTVTLLLCRIVREEHHLAQQAAYRTYMETVKYRILPFVF